MKAMIVSDFAVLRSVLLQLLGICLVIALFMGYVMGAVGTAAAIAAMVPFTGLFSLAAYDEQNNWERFRLTLPLTRRQVVFGRYASIALLTVGSLALALVLGLGIAALAGLLPAEWLPESLSPSENTPEMIVGSTVGGVSVVAIAMAVAMPVITRFGMTKAARIVPIIVVLIVTFAVAFFGNGVQLTGALADLVQWLDTGNNYLPRRRPGGRRRPHLRGQRVCRRQALREARVLASEARGAFRAQKSAIVRVLTPFSGRRAEKSAIVRA